MIRRFPGVGELTKLIFSTLSAPHANVAWALQFIGCGGSSHAGNH